jgi:hypothetical protein
VSYIADIHTRTFGGILRVSLSSKAVAVVQPPNGNPIKNKTKVSRIRSKFRNLEILKTKCYGFESPTQPVAAAVPFQP